MDRSMTRSWGLVEISRISMRISLEIVASGCICIPPRYPPVYQVSILHRTSLSRLAGILRSVVLMKILGINASPKGEKSQTRRLVMGVLDGARQAGADVTFVDICGLEIQYCTACGTCYAKGECIHDDDFPALLEKMMDADGIVLGSPNYINGVTAQLKTMLDRMADVVHCQSLAGKYGCSVCTAGGSYADEVADYMNMALLNYGVTTVGKVAVLVGADPNAIVGAEKKAKDLGRKLADAIKTKMVDEAQGKIHKERKEYFKQLVFFNKDLWAHEYKYWKGLGELK